MIASEIVAQRKRSDAGRHPPPAAIVSMPRPVVTAMSAEAGQLAAIARPVGAFSGAQPWERSLNNFTRVARLGPTTTTRPPRLPLAPCRLDRLLRCRI